jgi:hypothetical protein
MKTNKLNEVLQIMTREILPINAHNTNLNELNIKTINMEKMVKYLF